MTFNQVCGIMLVLGCTASSAWRNK